MADATNGSVLVVHHAAPVRRILRLNLEAERMATTEAATTRECLNYLQQGRAGAVVLDPEIFRDPQEGLAVCALLRELRLPVLVISERPEHRQVARAIGGAPFCNRPDDPERVAATVRDLLIGARVPAVV